MKSIAQYKRSPQRPCKSTAAKGAKSRCSRAAQKEIAFVYAVMPVRTMVINDSIGLLDEISRLLLLQPRIELAAVRSDEDEAWEEINQLRPELVVTNLPSKGNSRLEKTKELRRLFPSLCMIVIGADNQPDLGRHCREHGADLFIPKSRIRYDLWPAVQHAIKHHQETSVS